MSPESLRKEENSSKEVALAEIIIKPVSRMATPGSKVSFKVRLESEDASTVHVFPCSEASEYVVQLEEGGVEAPASEANLGFEVEVPAKASMA